MADLILQSAWSTMLALFVAFGAVVLVDARAWGWALVWAGVWGLADWYYMRWLLWRVTYPGQPKPTETTVVIQSPDRRHEVWNKLPIDPDTLRTFARRVRDGASLTEAAWVGKGFTRSQFVDLRDAMVRRGLVVARNPDRPASGFDVTLAGRRAFEYIADLPTPPSLLPQKRGELRSVRKVSENQ